MKRWRRKIVLNVAVILVVGMMTNCGKQSSSEKSAKETQSQTIKSKKNSSENIEKTAQPSPLASEKFLKDFGQPITDSSKKKSEKITLAPENILKKFPGEPITESLEERAKRLWDEKIAIEKGRFLAQEKQMLEYQKDTEAYIEMLKRQVKKEQAAEITALINQLGVKEGKNVTIPANRLIGIGEPAVPFLVDALKKWDEEKTEENLFLVDTTAKILGEIGSPAIPALKEASKNYKGRAKTYVVIALGLMAPKVEEAIDPLIQVLENDPDPDQKANAAFVLGEAGVVARKAIPSLQKAAKDSKDKELQTKAKSALKEIYNEEKLLNEWISGLQNPNPKIRHFTTLQLMFYLSTDRDNVFWLKDTIPILMKLLEDKDESYGNIPLVAANALGVFGPMAKRTLPAIIKASGTSWMGSYSAHQNFPNIIEKIGPPAKKDIPLITELLKNENWRIRLNAVRALEKAEREAGEAITTLKKLLDDENELVQKAAREAIEKIQKTQAP